MDAGGNMTYAGLLAELQGLSPDQLQQSVTIQHDDEFSPVKSFVICSSDQSVLDDGHFVLVRA